MKKRTKKEVNQFLIYSFLALYINTLWLFCLFKFFWKADINQKQTHCHRNNQVFCYSYYTSTCTYLSRIGWTKLVRRISKNHLTAYNIYSEPISRINKRYLSLKFRPAFSLHALNQHSFTIDYLYNLCCGKFFAGNCSY